MDIFFRTTWHLIVIIIFLESTSRDEITFLNRLMLIRAHIHNKENDHQVRLSTNEKTHTINISSKTEGLGSNTNGGELLFLALATCFCNDVYREAAKKGINILEIEVAVQGEFGGVGEPARNVSYNTKVKASNISKQQVKALLDHTDSVSEIQNTLRSGAEVQLKQIDIEIV